MLPGLTFENEPLKLTVPKGPKLAQPSRPLERPVAKGSAEDGEKRITKEDFDEWVLKLWQRIDRDHSGSLTKAELNCQEFHQMLRSVIAPSVAGVHNASYGRAEIHVEQLMKFLLRKADINEDGDLSFKEFKSMVRMLRNQRDLKDKTSLVFAMFDLDGTWTIDKNEFKEICRFYLGHEPSMELLSTEWGKLDKEEKGSVSMKEYTKWLRTSAGPVFNQVADAELDVDESTTCPAKPVSLRTPDGLISMKRRMTEFTEVRPLWNERFFGQDTSLINEASPLGLRTYFAKSKSQPELDRHFQRHPALYSDLRKRMNKPQRPKPLRILSEESDSAALLTFLPGRLSPDGSMRDKSGRKVEWNNEWVPPRAESFKSGRPGSLCLRCLGPPPVSLLKGRDCEDD